MGNFVSTPSKGNETLAILTSEIDILHSTNFDPVLPEYKDSTEESSNIHDFSESITALVNSKYFKENLASRNSYLQSKVSSPNETTGVNTDTISVLTRERVKRFQQLLSDTKMLNENAEKAPEQKKEAKPSAALRILKFLVSFLETSNFSLELLDNCITNISILVQDTIPAELLSDLTESTIIKLTSLLSQWVIKGIESSQNENDKKKYILALINYSIASGSIEGIFQSMYAIKKHNLENILVEENEINSDAKDNADLMISFPREILREFEYELEVVDKVTMEERFLYIKKGEMLYKMGSGIESIQGKIYDSHESKENFLSFVTCRNYLYALTIDEKENQKSIIKIDKSLNVIGETTFDKVKDTKVLISHGEYLYYFTNESEKTYTIYVVDPITEKIIRTIPVILDSSKVYFHENVFKSSLFFSDGIHIYVAIQKEACTFIQSYYNDTTYIYVISLQTGKLKVFSYYRDFFGGEFPDEKVAFDATNHICYSLNNRKVIISNTVSTSHYSAPFENPISIPVKSNFNAYFLNFLSSINTHVNCFYKQRRNYRSKNMDRKLRLEYFSINLSESTFKIILQLIIETIRSGIKEIENIYTLITLVRVLNVNLSRIQLNHLDPVEFGFGETDLTSQLRSVLNSLIFDINQFNDDENLFYNTEENRYADELHKICCETFSTSFDILYPSENADHFYELVSRLGEKKNNIFFQYFFTEISRRRNVSHLLFKSNSGYSVSTSICILKDLVSKFHYTSNFSTLHTALIQFTYACQRDLFSRLLSANKSNNDADQSSEISQKDQEIISILKEYILDILNLSIDELSRDLPADFESTESITKLLLVPTLIILSSFNIPSAYTQHLIPKLHDIVKLFESKPSIDFENKKSLKIFGKVYHFETNHPYLAKPTSLEISEEGATHFLISLSDKCAFDSYSSFTINKAKKIYYTAIPSTIVIPGSKCSIEFSASYNDYLKYGVSLTVQPIVKNPVSMPLLLDVQILIANLLRTQFNNCFGAQDKDVDEAVQKDSLAKWNALELSRHYEFVPRVDDGITSLFDKLRDIQILREYLKKDIVKDESEIKSSFTEFSENVYNIIFLSLIKFYKLDSIFDSIIPQLKYNILENTDEFELSMMEINELWNLVSNLNLVPWLQSLDFDSHDSIIEEIKNRCLFILQLLKISKPANFRKSNPLKLSSPLRKSDSVNTNSQTSITQEFESFDLLIKFLQSQINAKQLGMKLQSEFTAGKNQYEFLQNLEKYFSIFTNIYSKYTFLTSFPQLNSSNNIKFLKQLGKYDLALYGNILAIRSRLSEEILKIIKSLDSAVYKDVLIKLISTYTSVAVIPENDCITPLFQLITPESEEIHFHLVDSIRYLIRMKLFESTESQEDCITFLVDTILNSIYTLVNDNGQKEKFEDITFSILCILFYVFTATHSDNYNSVVSKSEIKIGLFELIFQKDLSNRNKKVAIKIVRYLFNTLPHEYFSEQICEGFILRLIEIVGTNSLVDTNSLDKISVGLRSESINFLRNIFNSQQYHQIITKILKKILCEVPELIENYDSPLEDNKMQIISAIAAFYILGGNIEEFYEGGKIKVQRTKKEGYLVEYSKLSPTAKVLLNSSNEVETLEVAEIYPVPDVEINALKFEVDSDILSSYLIFIKFELPLNSWANLLKLTSIQSLYFLSSKQSFEKILSQDNDFLSTLFNLSLSNTYLSERILEKQFLQQIYNQNQVHKKHNHSSHLNHSLLRNMPFSYPTKINDPIIIVTDGTTLSNDKLSCESKENYSLVRADYPINLNSPFYYFETKIEYDASESAWIVVGLSTGANTYIEPGQAKGGVGVNVAMGIVSLNGYVCDDIPKFNNADVCGLLWVPSFGELVILRNGNHVATVESVYGLDGDVYPAAVLVGAKITFNFGAKEFSTDYTKFLLKYLRVDSDEPRDFKRIQSRIFARSNGLPSQVSYSYYLLLKPAPISFESIEIGNTYEISCSKSNIDTDAIRNMRLRSSIIGVVVDTIKATKEVQFAINDPESGRSIITTVKAKDLMPTSGPLTYSPHSIQNQITNSINSLFIHKVRKIVGLGVAYYDFLAQHIKNNIEKIFEIYISEYQKSWILRNTDDNNFRTSPNIYPTLNSTFNLIKKLFNTDENFREVLLKLSISFLTSTSVNTIDESSQNLPASLEETDNIHLISLPKISTPSIVHIDYPAGRDDFELHVKSKDTLIQRITPQSKLFHFAIPEYYDVDIYVTKKRAEEIIPKPPKPENNDDFSGSEDDQEDEPEDEDKDPEPDPDLVMNILELGFSLNAARRAALAVNNSSLENATNWILEHMDDPDIEMPLPSDMPKGEPEKIEIPEGKENTIIFKVYPVISFDARFEFGWWIFNLFKENNEITKVAPLLWNPLLKLLLNLTGDTLVIALRIFADLLEQYDNLQDKPNIVETEKAFSQLLTQRSKLEEFTDFNAPSSMSSPQLQAISEIYIRLNEIRKEKEALMVIKDVKEYFQLSMSISKFFLDKSRNILPSIDAIAYSNYLIKNETLKLEILLTKGDIVHNVKLLHPMPCTLTLTNLQANFIIPPWMSIKIQAVPLDPEKNITPISLTHEMDKIPHDHHYNDPISEINFTLVPIPTIVDSSFSCDGCREQFKQKDRYHCYDDPNLPQSMHSDDFDLCLNCIANHSPKHQLYYLASGYATSRHGRYPCGLKYSDLDPTLTVPDEALDISCLLCKKKIEGARYQCIVKGEFSTGEPETSSFCHNCFNDKKEERLGLIPFYYLYAYLPNGGSNSSLSMNFPRPLSYFYKNLPIMQLEFSIKLDIPANYELDVFQEYREDLINVCSLELTDSDRSLLVGFQDNISDLDELYENSDNVIDISDKNNYKLNFAKKFTKEQAKFYIRMIEEYNDHFFRMLNIFTVPIIQKDWVITNRFTELKSLLLAAHKKKGITYFLKSGKHGASFQDEFKVSLDRNSVEPIFMQLFEELKKVEIDLLRFQTPPFIVSFNREEAQGPGVYNDCMTNVCDELKSCNSVNLFIECQNALESYGYNQDSIVPASSNTSTVKLEQYQIFGQLLGIAFRSNHYLAFPFPPIFWKKLTKEPVTRNDLFEIDERSVTLFNELENWDESQEYGNNEIEFVTHTNDRREIELIPGAIDKQIFITNSNRLEYVDKCEKFKLSEFDEQIEAIRRGMNDIIPIRYLTFLSWEDYETHICGERHINIQLLKDNTVYKGFRENEEVILSFWKVLESFSEDEKILFLKFAWGRTRLPRNKKEFEKQYPNHFTISKLLEDQNYSAIQMPDNYLPKAHTCYFQLDLPHYSSEEILKSKLLLAIQNCATMDIL